jgi:hypothetical protein
MFPILACQQKKIHKSSHKNREFKAFTDLQEFVQAFTQLNTESLSLVPSAPFLLS